MKELVVSVTCNVTVTMDRTLAVNLAKVLGNQSQIKYMEDLGLLQDEARSLYSLYSELCDQLNGGSSL